MTVPIRVRGVTKVCRKCLQEKALSELMHRSDCKYSRDSFCKECSEKYMSMWRKTPEGIKKSKKYRMKYRLSHRIEEDLSRKRFLLKHPNILKTWWKTRDAIRRGDLIKEPCEVCNKKGHAHHDDYTKPLQVRWFCNKHHKLYHAMKKRGIAGV